MRPTIISSLLIVHLCLCYGQAAAQYCESSVTIQLRNMRGGYFAGQQVTLTSKVDGKTFSAVSNASGEATIQAPCNELFELSIANHTKKSEIETSNGGRARYSFSYPPDMVQKEKLLAMNPAEQTALDNFFKTLPDTFVMKTSVMPPPSQLDYHALTYITITDLNGAPLANEVVVISGRKRGKNIGGATDKTGRLLVYLPKGDAYDLHFKHHRSYYYTDVPYTKGSTDVKLTFSYLGTREIEKRMKEEADRLAAEEKRLKEEKERFEKACHALGLTLEECHRREREKYLADLSRNTDSVISRVLGTHAWPDKLIVCDVTGSMDPYAAHLLLWYKLNFLHEKNLQFVLFNDGDDLPDEKKKIGETGGIYYGVTNGFDSLDYFIGRVQSRGSGGDAPENNMEALIKGISMAKAFKNLVMIADNHAPIKDIRLLSSFNIPVHIIVCGASDGRVHPDYLKLAWKTKGTLHTLEADITSLARMSEGQQILIGGITYRIMGGAFVEIRRP